MRQINIPDSSSNSGVLSSAPPDYDCLSSPYSESENASVVDLDFDETAPYC
jgi:hypothetical protein